MRMNIFDKFLLALILFLLLALSIFIGCAAAGIVPYDSVVSYFKGLENEFLTLSDINIVIFSAIAVALFVIAIRLFVASYSSGANRLYTRLVATENGEIAISIPTIKQIAAAFIGGKPDILASASTILTAKDGLFVQVRVCVKEGVLLPDVTAALQKELKAHLETVTGLAIKRVAVLVDNNRSSYSGKGR